jgi:hypothetical protein
MKVGKALLFLIEYGIIKKLQKTEWKRFKK